ncbi:NHLP bacteriocin export ABC transporter permease/ATPase subunit [Desertimonas flava]|uniref:NHLP bacteriocin export ABC transporter permease/ATPase subunit n=1 Tax=Desertimonas flava TaxID=2064846 RepID=UPI000E34AF67|nr:NHLP bacteriocin export ABC transporter permease/ATPase subunit [Desertimonas flava]
MSDRVEHPAGPAGGSGTELAAVVGRLMNVEGRDGHDIVALPADGACAVLSGSVDVFAAPVDPQAAEPWTHMARCSAGAVLVGADAIDGVRFIARPLPGASLARLDETAVAALVAAEPALASEGVEQYVAALFERCWGDTSSAPRNFVPLRPGEVILDRVGIARPVTGLVWLVGSSAPVEVHRAEDEPAPFAEGTALIEANWITGPEATAVTVVTTAAALQRPDGPHLVARAAEQALRRAVRMRREAAESEARRIAERSARDVVLVRRADEHFGQILAGVDRERAALVDTDPAFAAASIVGRVLGVEVVPARATDLRRGSDPVSAVASASRFRTRTVRLESGWYRHDAGPLIAFLKDGMHPVALVRRNRGYVIDDPTAGTVTPVDADTARTLYFEARMVYPPLPERSITGAGLLRFGFRNSAADAVVLGVASVIVAGLSLLTPILTGTILGELVPRAETDLIAQASILLLTIAVAVAAVSLVQNVAALRIEGRVDVNAQAGVWDRLMALPAPFFRRYSIGKLSAAALGINGIRDAVSGLAVSATLAFVTGLANLGLMLWYDVTLGLVAALVVAVGAAVSVGFGRRQVHQQRAVLDENNEVASTTFQLMTGMAKLRVAGAEDRAYAFWSRKFASMRALSFAARTVQNRLVVFNAGYAILAPGLIFAFIGVFRDGEFPLATFLSFNVAFVLFLGSTLQLTGTGITVLAIVPMFEQLRPILETVPEVDGGKLDPGELSGAIEVSHVTFGYDPDEPPVLQDVSFTAAPGEFVALVGPSGCGKSTLLRLLLGFEDPLAGAIRYDGRDLADLDAGAVRRQCGVVLQNGQLFAGDLLSNIVGSSTFTVEDAWEAVDMAGMREDIEQMPMGMNTLLPEGATTLSGGQRQRLMIARALISRPRIIFFDEATSALDNRTQAIVSASLHALNATRIVIAHRLSTIIHADRIVVMEAGRVVQVGTYDELMAVDGLFRQLASRQIA